MIRFMAAAIMVVGTAFPASDPAGSLPRRPRLVATTVPVIAAAGDIACASGTPTPTECRQQQTSDLLVGTGFDAVLPLRDLQYNTGALSAFQTSYDPTGDG